MKLYENKVGSEREVRDYMATTARMLAELAELPNWKEATSEAVLQDLLDACAEVVTLYARLT